MRNELGSAYDELKQRIDRKTLTGTIAVRSGERAFRYRCVPRRASKPAQAKAALSTRLPSKQLAGPEKGTRKDELAAPGL